MSGVHSPQLNEGGEHSPFLGGGSSASAATKTELVAARGVSVATYGAAGTNAAGEGETEGFEKAITAALAANAPVFIPYGSYNIRKTINIPDGISLISLPLGNAHNAALFHNFNGNMLNFEGGGGAQQLYLINNGAFTGAALYSKINAVSKGFLVFNRVVVTDFTANRGWQYDVNFNGEEAKVPLGIRSVFFNNCQFFGAYEPGETVVLNTVVHCYSSNCEVIQSPQEAVTVGVRILGKECQDVQFTGCAVLGNFRTEAAAGLTFEGRIQGKVICDAGSARNTFFGKFENTIENNGAASNLFYGEGLGGSPISPEPLLVKTPEEYGAERKAGHDDSKAITEAIEAAVKEAIAKGQTTAKVKFRAGIYYAERSVQELGYNAITKVATEKLWNTQIPLPIISPETAQKFTLILEGVSDATVGPHWNQEVAQVAGTTIRSTLKLTEAQSKTLKEANGAASVLGGPTKFVDEKPALGNFSNMLLVTTNLCILQEKNPGLIGCDARQLAQHNINSCSAMVNATPAELTATPPLNQFGYGFYLPMGGNNDNQNIGGSGLTVYGHYIGWVPTEHTTAQRVLLVYCAIGTIFSNLERTAGGGVTIEYLSSEAMSVAHIETVGTGGAKKGLPVNIGILNTGEGPAAGGKDIIDPENILRGYIGWECQGAGEPGVAVNARINGGANVTVQNLYTPQGKAAVTPSAAELEAGVSNPGQRNAMLTIVNAEVVEVDGAAQLIGAAGVASTVAWPANKVIKVKKIVAKTVEVKLVYI